MDFNDYVIIERAARDRLDDLRHVLFKHDVPRSIDRLIDYFGENGRLVPSLRARTCLRSRTLTA